MEMMPFVLLLGALALFLASTNQWKLPARASVVAGGAILLIFVFAVSDHRLFGALGDFSTRWEANKSEVAGYVLDMTDLFVILGAILGVAAVIAFSPGKAMENALRPIMVGLVGAVVGAALATWVIGAGLNAPTTERPLSITLAPDDVIEGDVILIKQRGVRIPYRLEGIDAPEIDQVCWLGQTLRDCGQEAREQLQRIVATAGTLNCQLTDAGPRERALASCVSLGRNPINLSTQMLEDGYALGEGNAPDPEAKLAGRGLLARCALAPSEWREMDAREREAFTQQARRRNRDRLTFNNPDNGAICPAAAGAATATPVASPSSDRAIQPGGPDRPPSN